MCYEDNFIYVTAIDRDEFPNSSPFEFTVVEGTSWNVEPFNGKIVTFSAPQCLGSSPPTQDYYDKKCEDVCLEKNEKTQKNV